MRLLLLLLLFSFGCKEEKQQYTVYATNSARPVYLLEKPPKIFKLSEVDSLDECEPVAMRFLHHDKGRNFNGYTCCLECDEYLEYVEETLERWEEIQKATAPVQINGSN